MLKSTLQLTLLLAGGVYLLLAGCSCGKQQQAVDDPRDEESGRAKEVESLPTLQPPELDVERALAAFQTVGTDQPLLEIPPLLEDLSAATPETEPNDRQDEATPLGASRLARGTSDDGYDYFRFDVEKPGQRWLIEVRGGSISRAEYSDAAGNRYRLGTTGDDGVLVAANLVLSPGPHFLSLRGSRAGESYTVRILPLGPVSESDDHEPNNDATRAGPLRAGGRATGSVYPTGDVDYYRFSTSGRTLVRLTAESPPDLALGILLSDRYRSGSTRLVRWTAGEPGQTFEDVRYLAAGDYLVAVSASGQASRASYSLRFEIVDPTGEDVVDLEPNDSRETALPMPPDRVLAGTLSGNDDYHALPPLTVDTRVTIRGPLVEAASPPPAEGSTPVPPRRATPKTITIYPLPGERKSLTPKSNSETGALEVDLAAGSTPVVRLRGNGPYRLEINFDPPLEEAARSETPALNVRLSAANLRFAAFLDRFQSTRLQVALANPGDQPITVDLRVSSDHYAWRPWLDEHQISLAGGETRVVEGALEVAPDAWSSRSAVMTLQALVEGEMAGGHSLKVFAECDALPVGSLQRGLLPEELAGGFNAAWQALGGRMVAEDERAARKLAPINNGFTYIDEGPVVPFGDSAGEITVELAGNDLVPVAGVLVNSQSSRPGEEWIRDFELLLSTDGESYQRVLIGTLDRVPIERAFALDTPAPARFARLRVTSTHGGATRWATLGEWKVVAAPEFDPSDGTGFNLADPKHGGHLVRWSWFVYHGHAAGMLTDVTERPDSTSFKVDPDLPTEWIVGFHHNRVAQIRQLDWIDREKRYYKPFDRVQVAVSTESPLGPWKPLGTWDLTGDRAGTRTWTLPETVWARFVRFSSSDAEKVEAWELPETLRIWESPSGPDYRSVLTEWGHYAERAFYESRLDKPAAPAPTDDDNDSRETAERLASNEPVTGIVTLGEDEDWYRVEIPSDSNTLDLEITGDPRLKATVEAFDEAGKPVAWDEEEILAQRSSYSALLGSNRTLYLRVSEPTRSIAFAWDNSGSVGGYLNTIYPAMTHFCGEVRPGLEFANLHPFGGDLLVEDWTDQPSELQYAVRNYPRRDSSSSAEPALGLVSDELAERAGTRAVVLLTDAASPSSRGNPALWDSLERSRPHVFTLHLHTSGSSGPYQQDLMQDWAIANGGRYAYFRTQGDLDAGFQRAACHIRRPASYRITARTRFEEPPGPGFLQVEPTRAKTEHAVELILDASGSMLQRIGGKTRIAIARDVLTRLVNETIPAGTPLALRVFGHRKPEACDTELVSPLAPLDRSRIAAIIGRTEARNLAKTPIGDSLVEVTRDLGGASGPKLVILITDGEETCGGDPAGAVRELKEAGIDARLSVVGFAIDDQALKAEFEAWARLGGGLYFDTADEDELGAALEAAMRPKFQVLNAAGEIVAEGTAGGGTVEVPMGLYQVKILTTPAQIVDDVRVEAEKTVTVKGE